MLELQLNLPDRTFDFPRASDPCRASPYIKQWNSDSTFLVLRTKWLNDDNTSIFSVIEFELFMMHSSTPHLTLFIKIQ